jgi:hypothetical protein
MFLALAAPALAQVQVPTPPGATRLAWDHPGDNVKWFEIVVDGRERVFLGLPCMVSQGYYEAPLPVLIPGLRRLTVEACNAAGCSASEPLLVSAVSAPIGAPPPAFTSPVCPPLLPGTPGRGGATVVVPYKPSDRRIPPEP